MLEALERGNLFLGPARRPPPAGIAITTSSPTCCEPTCSTSSPTRVPALHRRASEWYEQNGERSEAIRHALAGRRLRRAQRTWSSGRSRRCARADRRPPLLALARGASRRGGPGQAGAQRSRTPERCFANGELEGVEARLRDAERWLDPTAAACATDDPSTRMVVVDEEEFRRLPGDRSPSTAPHALAVGDVAGTVAYAPAGARPRRSEDDHLGAASAAATPGARLLDERGSRDRAPFVRRGHGEPAAKAGHLSDVIGCSIALADIRIAQGRLREAMRTYERGLQRREGPRRTRLSAGAADMHVGMSELFRERNDLAAAAQHLLSSRSWVKRTGLPQNRYRSRVAMARIRQAEGDLDGALELLDEAERLYVGDFSPDVRPVAAVKARAWIAQGQLSEADGLGAGARCHGRGRPHLRPRIRARHPRQIAPRAGHARSRQPRHR